MKLTTEELEQRKNFDEQVTLKYVNNPSNQLQDAQPTLYIGPFPSQTKRQTETDIQTQSDRQRQTESDRGTD